MNRRLLAIGAVVMALAVVTGSGAFTSIAADRGATVDVVGDAEMHLGLAPHSGPNGVYTYGTADGLAIDLTAGNPNVGSGGPIFGGTGPGVNVVETIDDAFNVTNQGTQAVRVWIDHDSTAVEFYTTTDDHGSIDGEVNAITVVPGRTAEVGMRIDSTGSDVGDVLLDGITINAAAEGADAPDGGGGDGGPDPDPEPDGQPSILIGAPQTFIDGPGKAYVVASPVAGTVGLAGAADATFTGEANDDVLGVGSAVAGDINGDGETDYIVGAWGNDDSGFGAGAAYIVYGPVSGTLNMTNADVTLDGPFSGGAGFTVAGAGDVNDDGFDDVLVGAPFNDSSTGVAYLVYGSASLSGTVDLTNADATFQGESFSDSAGRGLAGVGDVNGDGFDDIVVGAPFRDNVNSDEGAAYLIYGSASLSGTTSLGSADATFLGEAAFDRAGRSVGGAGDVNGDGFADIVVGAEGNDNAGGPSAGAAYVIYGGSGASAPAGTLNLVVADVKLEGDAPSDEAGTSVAGAGDIDDDGFDDLLVGAPGNDAAGTSAGAAYLVYGDASLAGTINLDDADLTIRGEAAGDTLGDITAGVAGVGDYDGDGTDDFVVASAVHDTTTLTDAGAVYLFYGGSLSGTVSAATADAKLVGADGDIAGISVSGGQ